ncbi:MAG: toll/interleukin-1 receptor domain-containing protein [Bradyrhizobium sp.]
MLIFINYRRDDSMGVTGRLHDRLADTFGRKNLFMDVDSIPPGVDFVKRLNDEVARSDILLTVIGPDWLELKNEEGNRRLQAADDFVALEIAAALARDIPVIPILVDGARMPKASDLPEPLKPLAHLNASVLRHDCFGRDVAALIENMRAARPTTRSIWKMAAISGLLAISSGAVSYYVWPSTTTSAAAYAADGNFACFDKAEYPDSWRTEAPLCGPYGCNFGKMPQAACLALAAGKQSKTVIHGNAGTTRAGECWLQNACGDLRPHGEFTLFRMSLTGFF